MNAPLKTAHAPQEPLDKPTVVMIHGAFCGGWAFDRFRQPFEAAGMQCLAPDLRGHAAGAGKGGTAGVSMAEYAADVAALVRAQVQPPILIGHSLGGLVAQMAASLAPVRGLILLAPSPPWGIAGGSLEEAASAVSLYTLGAFWLQAIDPDYASANLYSLNRMAPPAREAIFARMTPESGRALWETLNWWLDPFMTTQVGPISAPTLALSGGRDLVHPTFTVKQTAERLGAQTREFAEMSHWLLAEPGWEAVAEACLTWLAQLAPAPREAQELAG
jgi:pimeloyl-ACP methyl ester carboxylesterase